MNRAPFSGSVRSSGVRCKALFNNIDGGLLLALTDVRTDGRGRCRGRRSHCLPPNGPAHFLQASFLPSFLFLINRAVAVAAAAADDGRRRRSSSGGGRTGRGCLPSSDRSMPLFKSQKHLFLRFLGATTKYGHIFQTSFRGCISSSLVAI